MSKKKKNSSHKKRESVIEAAGAVIFRNKVANDESPANDANRSATEKAEGLNGTGAAGLEILLEHRAKYDDWSIPKGKVDGHESLAHTAVREVGEETGLSIRLSAKIGEVHYPLHLDGSEGERDKKHKGGKHHRKEALFKHVTYWAGVPINDRQASQREQPFGHPDPRDKEVDQLQWLGIDEARRRLTYDDDRAIIDRFSAFVASGGDHAATLIFVRHGEAEKRKGWNWPEALRPLTPEGAAESFALAREIACYAPNRLLSSPWRRCRQTLDPYAVQSGLHVELLPQMTEKAAAANPPAAVSVQEGLVQELSGTGLNDRSAACAVVCLHRPVLGLLLPLVADTTSASMTGTIPESSPWLEPGTGLAITFARHEGRLTVLDAHQLTPVVY